MTDFATTASMLCSKCGMCCNGVMFDGMRVQEGDSERGLVALGLKLKRCGGMSYFLQPCAAHGGGSCAIYEDRPVRCRVFECRQLKLIETGEASADEALRKIEEAGRRVARVRDLFRELGDEREHKAFSVRLAGVRTPPLDNSPTARERREALEAEMAGLENLLSRDFRTEPAGGQSAAC